MISYEQSNFCFASLSWLHAFNLLVVLLIMSYFLDVVVKNFHLCSLKLCSIFYNHHIFSVSLFIVFICLYKLQGGVTSGTTLLFIVFLGSMTLGIVLMCFVSKRHGKEEMLQDSPATFSSSVWTLLNSMSNLLLDIRILLVIPLIAYSGLQQAFVW